MTRGRCRSCGAEVIWAKTEAGRPMPVDVEPDPAGNLHLWLDGNHEYRCAVIVESWPDYRPRFRPHFATCPDAQSWRRR
jgi:hypothetical protein